MKRIQELLCHFLQMVITSKMLQLPLCIDALFERLQQSAKIQNVSPKVALHRPNSFTKAMEGLLKYNGNR